MVSLAEIPDREGVRHFIAQVISKYGRQRRYLMQMLQEVQSRYGYLPRSALKFLSELTDIPLSDVLNVATFYHQFKLEAPGLFIIMVCMGTACHLRGNNTNYEFLRNFLSIKHGQQTSDDGVFTIEKARCFGCCSLAPVIMIRSRDGKYRKLYGYVNPQSLRRVISEHRVLAKKMFDEGGVHA